MELFDCIQVSTTHPCAVRLLEYPVFAGIPVLHTLRPYVFRLTARHYIVYSATVVQCFSWGESPE